jgi:hypothetical protein
MEGHIVLATQRRNAVCGCLVWVGLVCYFSFSLSFSFLYLFPILLRLFSSLFWSLYLCSPLLWFRCLFSSSYAIFIYLLSPSSSVFLLSLRLSLITLFLTLFPFFFFLLPFSLSSRYFPHSFLSFLYISKLLPFSFYLFRFFFCSLSLYFLFPLILFSSTSLITLFLIIPLSLRSFPLSFCRLSYSMTSWSRTCQNALRRPHLTRRDVIALIHESLH